ncbi:MAG: Uma2 family endonuclease [Desulfuromonadaceae bacterium]|nr:Uma2 family endonuclease [Desulfuromonadaceae bacterium]
MSPLPMLKEQERFTYADYLSWSDDERWELINGVPYSMSPAPSRLHQEISGNIHGILHQYLKGKECKLYAAPFDVRLPGSSDAPDDEIDTVVQPDIVVICDPDKLDDKGCKGVPDLVIEILSPRTAEHDLKDKFYLYQRVGVLEYWIVNQTDKTLMIFKLNAVGEYGRPEMYGSRDIVAVPLLGDLEIDLAEVFAS